jgi:uncharacterized membrane protein
VALNRGLSRGTPAWVVGAYTGALAGVFVGERVVPTIAWLREILLGVGVLLVLVLTGLRWMATRGADGEGKVVERALAILSTLGALAIALYLTTADPFEDMLGVSKWSLSTRTRYETVATVAWVALLLGSVLPMLFAERALFPMRRAACVEWRRAKGAIVSGVTLALVVTYGALFCFVAAALDIKADYSFFHTAKPSEATRKIAASATDPITVLAFFPELNPVGDEVAAYVRDLGRGLPNVDVHVYDRLLVPQIAKNVKVNDDGVLVIEHGAQRESLTLGVDIAAARPKLRTLDNDVQKTLLKVLREKRTAYLTVGHGELNDTQPTPENQGRTGKGIRELLQQQNYSVRELSAASGLGTDVPDDATVVFVLGPEHAFQPEEVESLRRYLDRGGKLFLCLDPEPKLDLTPLADLVGVTISQAILANDKVHMRRRFNDSDRVILATNRFSSHASVSTLSRIGSRPVFFLGAGAIDKKGGGSTQVDLAVRAMPDTFDDINGNYRFDPPEEKRSAYGLAAATSRKLSPREGSRGGDEARAFVVGDADAISDAALSNEGNILLIADALRWLAGEESLAGAMSSAEDVHIEHTKQKDLVWFYGTIFAAPAIVLGGGLVFTRRRGRRVKKGAPAGGAS